MTDLGFRECNPRERIFVLLKYYNKVETATGPWQIHNDYDACTRCLPFPECNRKSSSTTNVDAITLRVRREHEAVTLSTIPLSSRSSASSCRRGFGLHGGGTFSVHGFRGRLSRGGLRRLGLGTRGVVGLGEGLCGHSGLRGGATSAGACGGDGLRHGGPAGLGIP